MINVELKTAQVDAELDRIVRFIATELAGEKAVLAISGGLDSDVVARLAVRAVGLERLKLFVVLQEGMDPRHLENARQLSKDLAIPLAEIDLSTFPRALVSALANADPAARFRPDGLLDPGRAKCSLRTAVLSTYLDRGYLVLGTSNRTEFETGFFLPLGDGLGHLKPIIHLYKTQIRQLAGRLGVRDQVLEQPASSGFWIGAEDLLDVAYWLYNEAPIIEESTYDQKDLAEVTRIRAVLTTERLDQGLVGLRRGLPDAEVSDEAGLPLGVVARLRRLTTAAKRWKLRPLGRRLEQGASL